MSNLAVEWSPSQLAREDHDDHPEVASLKEACRRVAAIDDRGYISVRFDSFDPPIVQWTLENKSRHWHSPARERSTSGDYEVHVCAHDHYEIDNVEGIRVSIAVRTACPGRCK